MILVAGSTGYLGSEICRRLSGNGHTVRALVRATSNPASVELLKKRGIEVVVGDVKDPASLEQACQGVDKVISTVASIATRQEGDSFAATDVHGHINLLRASRAAGVDHFIFISVSGGFDSDDPLMQAKRTIEGRVQESGMRYTILRPSCFMEVWLSPLLGFDYTNAKATIYGTGDQKLSFISLSDVAELAVRSVNSPAALDAIIDLGGPEAISPKQIVQTFEQVSGRKFDVQFVPAEVLRAQKDAATDELQRVFAALMLAVSTGDIIDMTATLRNFPVRLRSVREYAQSVLQPAVAV